MAPKVTPPTPIIQFDFASLWWEYWCPLCGDISIYSWPTKTEAYQVGVKHIRLCHVP